MSVNTINLPPEPDYNLKKARGIGTIVLVVFIVIWVLSLTGVNLFLRWSIEQSMFEADTGINDGRWLVNLICGFFLFIPLLTLYFGRREGSACEIDAAPVDGGGSFRATFCTGQISLSHRAGSIQFTSQCHIITNDPAIVPIKKKAG